MSYARGIAEQSTSPEEVASAIEATLKEVTPELAYRSGPWKKQAQLMTLAVYGAYSSPGSTRPAWVLPSGRKRKGFVDSVCDLLHCGRPTYD